MSQGRVPAVCALCETQAPLRRSHIIPRFVARALQVPDGPTRALLCGRCEELLGRNESTFARVVFHPLVDHGRVVAKYDKWLLRFAVSVCWRVLEDGVKTNQFLDSENRWTSHLASCRETWRQFLVGKRADVEEYPIHLFPANLLPGGGQIEMAVRCGTGDCHVYARLGPIILFGLISNPAPKQWGGTRIHLEGKVKPREFFIPPCYRTSLDSPANRQEQV